MPLNENGRRQAELLGGKLQGVQIDAAYVSPLGRAVETAEIALKAAGTQAVVDERLKDFCYGQWTGLAEDEVGRRWPRELAEWQERPGSARVPGGDKLGEVFERAFGAMEEWGAKHEGQTVAIFAHRVVNKLLVVGALGLGLERFGFIRQDNCCVDEFERTADGYVIVSLNDTSHLRGGQAELLHDDF